MRSKLSAIVMTTIISAALLISVAAQQPRRGKLDPHPDTQTKPMVDGRIALGTQVKLPCKGVSGGDVRSTVQVKNTTGNPIPALTMIYLATSNGSGKEALSAALANNATANLYAPPGSAPSSCEAWYFKK